MMTVMVVIKHTHTRPCPQLLQQQPPRRPIERPQQQLAATADRTTQGRGGYKEPHPPPRIRLLLRRHRPSRSIPDNPPNHTHRQADIVSDASADSPGHHIGLGRLGAGPLSGHGCCVVPACTYVIGGGSVSQSVSQSVIAAAALQPIISSSNSLDRASRSRPSLQPAPQFDQLGD